MGLHRSTAWALAALLTAASWLIVIAVMATRDVLVRSLWLLVFPVIVIAWLLPAVAAILSAKLLWRHARWWGIAFCVTVTCAMTLFTAGVDWLKADDDLWYALHEKDFAAVARLGDDTSWVAHAPDGYFGPQLPEEYQYLSQVKSLSRIGVSNGAPVWFLARSTGIPDCAAGYAHFTGTPDANAFRTLPNPNAYLDGFGCAVHPTREYSGGWWWVE